MADVEDASAAMQLIDILAEAECRAITQAAVDEGTQTMANMCGNPGQFVIIFDSIDGYFETAEVNVVNGEDPEWSVEEHEDVVIYIESAGLEILRVAAVACAEIRTAARDAKDELAADDGEGE